MEILHRTIFLPSFLVSIILCSHIDAAATVQQSAQDSINKQAALFAGDDPVQMKLTFNFDSVLKDVDEIPVYCNALLSYVNAEGDQVQMDVEIRTRGSFRKDTINCNFPPLKIKFNMPQGKQTLFEGIKAIDMVTHCQNESEEYEQYLLQEYLIYRCYNILTDMSFRVRLCRVTYTDTGAGGRVIEKFGFFLEDRDDMAERNHANILDISVANPARIDQDQFTLVSFFEYMIINTDWSLPIMHNIEVISTDYFEAPYPVPYDFDWSAIINIPYQVPGIGNKAETPRVREFKGACRTNKEFRKIIDLYIEKRLEIYNLYLEFEYLDEYYKQLTFRDLNDFYTVINNRELFRSNIRENCTRYKP
jgi:hypothetical protein